jgi:MFS superfamily sulfate permease-like transporter
MAYQVIDPPVHVLGRKPGTTVFRPRSLEHPEDESFPGLLLIRLEGRLFFANAQNVSDKIRSIVEVEKPRVVALDLGGVFDLEYTALKLLTEAELCNRELGTITWLVGLNPGVSAVIQRSPLGGILGTERLFFNVEEAVARYVTTPVLKEPR